MAGKNIKGINLEIGGSTTKFNKAMKDMSSVTRATQKELDAVNKSLKFDPKNVDLLKQKEELLAKQIEDTRVKVDKLKAAKTKADEEMANGTEVNQEQYRQLVREISAAEGQLKSLIRQNDNFGNSARELGDKIEGIGKKGMAVSGAIIGIGTAAVGMGIKAAQSADDINTLSKQTGLSTEQIQKFQYASERIDVPLETLTGSMAKLTRNMQSAKNGSKNTQLAFKELGISITDNEGKLRNNQDVFNEAINALAKMKNETQRDALAMQIFGKSAQDLNPLILGGSEALKQYGEEAEKAGLILSQETLDAANELGDAVDKFKATATGSFAKVGAEIATKLTPLIGPASNMLVKVVNVVSDLDEGQVKLIAGLGIATATIPPLLIGTGKMITAIGTISTAYKTMAASATAASIASKAIPFIGVAAGAIALVGAISALTSATNKEMEETLKLQKAYKERNDEYQRTQQAAQEQAEASISEMSYIQNLKDELISLADENGKVAESDKARAEFILGQLNNALGTEYSMTGLIIGNYKDLSVAIDNLITKKKTEIILSSKEDAYKNAIKNIQSTKKELDEAKKAWEEAVREYGNDTSTMTIAQADYVRTLYNTYNEISKVYDKQTKIIEDYEETSISIAKDGGKKIVEEFEKTAGLAAEKGAETAENFNEGMKGVDVQTPAKEVGQASVKALGDGTERDNEGNTPKMLGEAVVDGLMEGFESKMPTLEIRSQQMGQKIIAALKSKEGLDVNSPSKPAIPVGEAISEGLAVGIEKDMSAEESLEKKCSNLKKILSDFTSGFKADIDIAESEFDLWKSENPNADDEVKRSKEREMLVKTAIGQDSTIKAINDALWILGETAGTDSVEYKNMLADLNKAKQDLSETNAKIADIDRYLPQLYSEGNVALAESQYILWKARNPEASEHENLIQQEKKLNVEYEEQGKKVKDLNDELYISNQLYGESSEESKKLLAQLNKEIAAYEDLGRQIAEVNEQKSQYTSLNGKLSSGERSPASVYAAYHVQYGALLKSEGMSQEEIDKAARKVSGYAGQQSISITNNNYGVTPDTAYEVSKGTQKALNNYAMQGVL